MGDDWLWWKMWKRENEKSVIRSVTFFTSCLHLEKPSYVGAVTHLSKVLWDVEKVPSLQFMSQSWIPGQQAETTNTTPLMLGSGPNTFQCASLYLCNFFRKISGNSEIRHYFPPKCPLITLEISDKSMWVHEDFIILHQVFRLLTEDLIAVLCFSLVLWLNSVW